MTAGAASVVRPVVAIERIAAGGDGVGRLPDGRVVFVPRTAPGDQVEIEIVREEKRLARARVTRIERAGPDRVPPRCPHYAGDECGGCQLQHLSPAAQRHARRAIVGDALRRIGGLDLADPELEPAPADWGYRTRISVTRGRGRRFGFHRLGRPDLVFDLVRCELAAASVQDLWSRVRAAIGQLPPEAERLTLRVDRRGGEHVLVECRPGRVWTGAEAFGARIGAPAGRPVVVWWKPDGGVARVLAGGDDPYPAVVFEQVHPAVGDRIRAWAVSALAPLQGRRVWDLYAGIGETSAALARSGALVHSVEADPRAVDEAERRHQAAGLTVESRRGRVEDHLASLPPPDLVITNPPRTGMAPAVTEALRAGPAARIAYVSCDPATLGRDLRRLVAEGPFRLAGLRAFDLFPQTAHVEAVAVLERA